MARRWRRSFRRGGRRFRRGAGVVLMKIGSRLREIVDLLEQLNVLDRSVFVSRAGLPDQRVELDLNHLRDADETTGNLAVIIVQAAGE